MAANKRKKCGGGEKEKFLKNLEKLKSLKSSHKCQAVAMANNAFIRKLCAEVRKLRYKNVNANTKKKIDKNRAMLRKIINPRTTLERKRYLLSQKGGILPLIPILLSALGPALGGVSGGVAHKVIR